MLKRIKNRIIGILILHGSQFWGFLNGIVPTVLLCATEISATNVASDGIRVTVIQTATIPISGTTLYHRRVTPFISWQGFF